MATSFFMLKNNSTGESSCSDYDEVKTPSGPLQVNSWHTQGRNMETAILPLCQLVREKLPRKDDLPIFVGNTGYIHISEDEHELPDSWTEDDLGRTVFVIENDLYFQRYKSGGCIVCRKFKDVHWDALTKEQIENLTQTLNNL